MNRKVLALSGWKKSGKDTMAEYLIKEHGYTRLALADVLKEMVAEVYDVPLECFHDQAKKESPLYDYPVITADEFSRMLHSYMDKEFARGAHGGRYWTPRALLILEGSVKRSVNSKHWLNTVLREIFLHSEKNYVITDTRYCSEIEQLREELGDELTTVRIERHEESPSNDPSERDLDDFTHDIYIYNKSTVEEFHKTINTTIHTLTALKGE